MQAVNKLLHRVAELDTIEKKSFWIMAPVTVMITVISVITMPMVYTSFRPLIIGILGIIIPSLLMAMCIKKKNYHFAYPALCISIGAVWMPLLFVANGGFDSGMPIFCAFGTLISAFCYERLWRYISLAISLFSNTVTFFVVKKGFTFGFASTANAENDIILSYIFAVIGVFIVVNMIITEARNYAVSSEVLKTCMDIKVRRQLLEQANHGNLDSHGVKRKVSVLFADISRFTSITEKMSPEQAADFLNTFLNIADECIHDNGGVIDKYIGDCVMAYWIDAEGTGYGNFESVKAVEDMRMKVYSMAEEIYSRFGDEMDFSAGIDCGEVVFGSIGSKGRKDYTIIGDCVNTANRLQTMASRGELLVSNNVAAHIGKKVKMSLYKEKIYLKGKNTPMNIYLVEKIYDAEEVLEQEILKPDESEYAFYVCGCRGSFPVSGLRHSEFGGETTCYVLKKNRYAVVIDCGTGLFNAKELLQDCEKIDILLTHVHYDHILGLLDTSVFPKDVPIRMFGHFGGWIGNNTVRDFMSNPYWPVDLPEMMDVDVMIGRSYLLYEDISAAFFRSYHPNNGCVIRLMAGSHKICIFTDCEDPYYIDEKVAMDSDLLLYDGMYEAADKKLHNGWGHSTWEDAVVYAKKENVGRLVVTHHNPEYGDSLLKKNENMAKERFPAAIFARAGDKYVI